MTERLPDLDHAAIAELRQVLGSEFAVLLDTFVADGERKLAAMRATLAAGDAHALREAAHSFKGASLNVGAPRLADLCLAIETRARAGQLDGLAAQLDDTQEAFLSACRALGVR